MRTLVFLQEIGLRDAAVFGEEAAALSDLYKVGIPVAPAFVLPSAAYAEFLSSKGARQIFSSSGPRDPESLRRELAGLTIPPRLSREILEFYRRLSGPRDIFVSVRAGNTAARVGSGEELLAEIKRIWVGHLVTTHLRGGDFFREALPILVQQETVAELAGELVTSAEELASADFCLVEVNHPGGKERFVLEKSSGREVRRIISGSVEDQTDIQVLGELSVWAPKIEQVLGGVFRLGWTFYQGQFVFSYLKRFFLPPQKAAVLDIWVEATHHALDSVPGVGGVVVRDAKQAVAIARRFPHRAVLLFLEPFNFEQLEDFREGKRKLGMKNLHLILPPVRTVDGMRELKRYLSGERIQRGTNLKFFFQVVYPANVILLDQFLQVGVDGVVLNEEEVAKSLLGTVEKVEPDESLIWAVKETARQCQTARMDFLYRAGQPRDWLLLELTRLGVNGVIVPQHQHAQYVESLREAEGESLLKSRD